MFSLNIRFQIAAICVFMIILIDYYKNPHLKLLSSRCFRILLSIISLYLCFDILSVYTITHSESVPAVVNRLVHQIFIFMVLLTFFINYFYIYLLAYDQKRMPRKKFILVALPFVISCIYIIGGRLEYYRKDAIAYSYGPMVNVVYFCAAFYLILIFILSYRKKVDLTKMQRNAIRLIMAVWTIIFIIQLLFPKYLVSCLGFVLGILIIYLVFENQKESYDVEMECFNHKAFHKMLGEYYERRKELHLINLTCENLERVNRLLGHEEGLQVMKYLANTFGYYTNEVVYYNKSNVISIFVTNNLQKIFTCIQGFEEELKNNPYHNVTLYCNVTIMDIHKYTTTQNEVYELIDFMSEKSFGQQCKIHFLSGDTIIDKRRHNEIETLLNNAIEINGFEIVYQPIFNVKEQEFHSAEALLRLKDTGKLGFVSPEEFIPLAEEKGMILRIGDKVLELVASFIQKYEVVETQLKYIEVNISALQAVTPRLNNRMKRIVDKYQVPPSFINFEITETAMINFGQAFIENITSLKENGFSFSMDDFGTGYSNFSQMNQVKYKLIKIDKSILWAAFDQDNETAKQGKKVLKSVIKLLKNMGVKIVVEGVETKEMVEYLTQRGVDYLQGYYFSKPLKEEDFIQFLIKQKR